MWVVCHARVALSVNEMTPALRSVVSRCDAISIFHVRHIHHFRRMCVNRSSALHKTLFLTSTYGSTQLEATAHDVQSGCRMCECARASVRLRSSKRAGSELALQLTVVRIGCACAPTISPLCSPTRVRAQIDHEELSPSGLRRVPR